MFQVREIYKGFTLPRAGDMAELPVYGSCKVERVIQVSKNLGRELLVYVVISPKSLGNDDWWVEHRNDPVVKSEELWTFDFDGMRSYFTDWGSAQVGNLWCKFRDGEVIPESVGGSAKADKKFHRIPSVDSVACTDQMGEPGFWHERLSHFKLEFTPSAGEEIQTEFFVDRKDAAAAIEAVSKLGPEITPLLWITELRTVAADDLWLSGAYQRDTLAIHFTWKKLDAIYPVIEKVEAALRPFHYRPHWGKVFTANAQYLKSVYPKMGEFQALMLSLDPSKKFENTFTRSKM